MSGNIFGGNDKTGSEFKDKVDVHSRAIITVTERLKTLESSLEITNEKIELVDHNSISNFKKIFSDVKSLRSEITELREDIKNIKEFNKKVVKQVQLMTTKDEVAKLEKYIDIWSPMDFITREEFDKSRSQTIDTLRLIIEEFLTGKLDKKLKEKLEKPLNKESTAVEKKKVNSNPNKN